MAPESLRHDAMVSVWSAVRERLEAMGVDNRGRVRLPPLTSAARLTLKGLLGRELTRTVDLAELERALTSLGVGTDLATALELMGFAVSPEPAERRAARHLRSKVHDSARAAIDGWPEPWAGDWVNEVIRAGLLRSLDADEVGDLVAAVRKVIDRVGIAFANDEVISRTDLAATLLGSSHALDSGSAIEAACTRALARWRDDADSINVWDRLGVHSDQVSGAALTWGLPLDLAASLVRIVAPSIELGIPLHLTSAALRKYPVRVPAGTNVLVTENPRVVEAAASRRLASPVVTTNGNPSAAVRLLLDQLLESNAVLRYHGDFDTPGLAICARMQRLGLVPWRMTADDYRAAVNAATAAGVNLPLETRLPGSTPWDPSLAVAMTEIGRIVHEERLLDQLLE